MILFFNKNFKVKRFEGMSECGGGYVETDMGRVLTKAQFREGLLRGHTFKAAEWPWTWGASTGLPIGHEEQGVAGLEGGR